ncbi:MAG: hypothetical protein V7K86_24225 [Nostoc sp.]|uniref:hypothetical protein n=1 Tax=Nostoc sp. TaxID=1180 RepID=UPI002FF4ACF7
MIVIAEKLESDAPPKRKIENDFRSLAVLTTMVGTPSDRSIVHQLSSCMKKACPAVLPTECL